MGHRRASRLRKLAAVGLVIAAPVAVAACASDGSGSTATTTTVDPLAERAIDACGNDLSDLKSTVTAVDAATGVVRWTVSVPLADAYLLRDDSGGVRVSLPRRHVDALIDLATGEVSGYPAAGVHEVLTDPTGTSGAGVGGLLVDGEAEPATLEVDGLRITTAAGELGQATVGLTATDATDVATAAPVWRVDLGPADEVASLSPPVLYGDTVVVVTSPPQPVCR